MIEKVRESSEKEMAIKLCDDALPRGLCKHENYSDIFKKIDEYVDFFASFVDGSIAGCCHV